MTPGWRHPAPEGWYDIAYGALAEDIGTGDISAAVLKPDQTLKWVIEAQGNGVACGIGLAVGLLQPDPDDPVDCYAEASLEDGAQVSPGTVVAEGMCEASRLLARERTVLNFIMLLSGTASLTRQFVDKVQGLDVAVVDTRKTAPYLRSLLKYAVRCGGGKNHRMGLYDGVLLKDNHLRAVGSVREAVEAVKKVAGQMTLIEVECETMEQVEEAVGAGADIVMLDNMDPFMMKDAVKKFGKRIRLEASGGVTLETVRGVAQTGVHAVSVGALTHSAAALPFHLEIK
ncbi:MAG TPA: carboxylating nicotinate-nucleotide diphosphorylase [Fimbriimonadaceae bacterium]|nr:carboxylating nicotinate-nucleotide diphosphorylase [Fimbriimonadaceae bacterium]